MWYIELMNGGGKPTRLGYLDALRGYAVLAVIIVHSGASVRGMTENTTWGAHGVQLFFVVSAFTIAMMWENRNDGALAFYIRRLFRIAPMFWLAIIFYLVLYWLGASRFAPANIEPWHVALTAAFLHGLHPETINSVVPGDWSIANEMMFYAMFPAIAFFTKNIWYAAILFAISAWIALIESHNAGFVSSLFASQGPREIQEYMFLWMPAQFSCFAAGMLAYATFKAVRDWRLNPSIFEVALVLAIARVVWLCIIGMADAAPFALPFAVIVLSFASGAGRYFVWKPIVTLGRYSFSVYLIHFAFVPLGAAAAVATGALGIYGVAVSVVIVTALTALISSQTYRFIELPMIRLGERLSSYQDAATSEPLPPTKVGDGLTLEPVVATEPPP